MRLCFAAAILLSARPILGEIILESKDGNADYPLH